MHTKNKSDRERLLHLIDGDQNAINEAKKKRSSKESFYKIRDGLRQFQNSLGRGITGGFSRTKNFAFDLVRGKAKLSKPDLPVINRILIAVLVLLGVYLSYDFVNLTIFEVERIMEDIESEQNLKDQFVSEEQEILELGPLESYVEPLSSKNIFATNRIDLAQEGSVSNLAGLKFVGVDWDDVPTAMIEDEKEGKTYFVKKGDTVKTIRIIEVLKDRVLFSLQGNLYELK